MATDGEPRNVPDQAAYEAETADTRWVELKKVDGSFQVREVAPLKLLRDMDKYGVLGLMQGDDGVDSDDLLGDDADFSGFMEDLVVPNVVQPSVYWGDDSDGDFDLAALDPMDLRQVIAGMTGQDPDELQERADESRFPG